MTAAKKGLVVLLVFSILCSVLTLGTAVTALLPTNDQLPVSYDLYDYLKDVDTSFKNQTTLTSDSPWSAQINVDGAWVKPDTLNVSAPGKATGYSSTRNWESTPGFGYDVNDGQYQAFLYPCNKDGESTSTWKIDAAYAFTAPVSGTYTFGRSDSAQKLSDEICDYFKQVNWQERDLPFGVRVVKYVGTTEEVVWPKGSEDYVLNGYAYFGQGSFNDPAWGDPDIKIPVLAGIHLNKGEILRVEARILDGNGKDKATAGAQQAITCCVNMKLTEIDETEQDDPTSGGIPTNDRYELYDYFYEMYAEFEDEGSITGQPLNYKGKSNWKVEAYFDDQWNEPDTFYQDGSYYYVGCSGRAEWGNQYPGYAFYYNPHVTRNQLAVVTPTNAAIDQAYDCNTAYTFTATLPGTYEFHYSDADKAASFADTQYFAQYELGYTGITFGVRITLGDKVIWPTTDNYNAKVQDTYALFGREINGIPSEIAIPKLANLKMLEGEVLRVEFTSFTEKMDAPFNQRVKGCVSMTRVSTDTTKDEEAPKFNKGNIALSESGEHHLVLAWPTAKDNATKEQNLSYTLFYDTEPYAADEIPTKGLSVGAAANGAGITRLESDTDYYFAVLVKDESYNKAFITGGPFRTKKSSSTAAAVFEVYDYLDEVAERLPFESQKVKIGETQSPWVGQVLYNGKWQNITLCSRLDDRIYCNVAAPEWGGYYPGYSFGAPRQSIIKRCYARLNPTKAAASVNANFDYQMAFTFNAPSAGVYTFEKGNQTYAVDDYLGANFAVADGASRDYVMGIRIVRVDSEGEEVLWPKANDSSLTIQEGYATISGYRSETGSIPIPTIENLRLLAGDTIRVETKAFTATADSPWLHQISAYVRMVMTQKIEDKEPPVFDEGDLTVSAKSTNSLTFNWPLAYDSMSRDDSLVYKLYFDTQPVTEDRFAALEETAMIVSGGSQRVTMLESGKDYYAALTVTDTSNNTAMLFGGPFATDKRGGGSGGGNGGSGSGSGDGNDGNVPSAPLASNRSEDDCGLKIKGEGEVEVGWNATGSMSFYRVFAFKNNALVKDSGNLSPTAKDYTFTGLSKAQYTIQVVGYNNQGEPFEIYPALLADLTGKSGPVSGSGLGSNVGSAGSATGEVKTTYITNEGVTQVQDLYETVTKTKTITNGPTTMEYVLWISLLVVGGLMLAGSIFFLVLLLKKPKNVA